jgi:hypothetical protein
MPIRTTRWGDTIMAGWGVMELGPAQQLARLPLWAIEPETRHCVGTRELEISSSFDIN